ncbi:MAG: hypothetical protein J6T10_26940 [Methanobrevibacter sp.]|nr:hypothetical protein [Methanobrevibacter sp.]
MRYQVFLKVENGGVTPIFQTNLLYHALGFCKSKNEFYESVNSPNRYYFEMIK